MRRCTNAHQRREFIRMLCTAEFIQRSLHSSAQRGLCVGPNSASRLDRVLGPRRPVLGRAIAGIASDGISVTGTGVGRIGRGALISIARSTGVSGLSRITWVCIARRTGVSGVSRVTWVSIARLRVARISVGGISVSRRSVGRVAEIGARWGWRGTRNSSEYPGCPSDGRSERGSRPATRRCSNGSTRSRSQYAPTKAALNRVIRVGAGRETQRRHGNHKGRNSGHCCSPVGRRPGRPTTTTDTSHPFSRRI